MKRSLAVSIILRFPIAASLQLVAALERCLDAVDAAGELVVNWNYPLHALLSDSSSRADNVVRRLKERADDLHLPMGYVGAYHPLLAPDELRREIRWMEKNPWKEDLQTGFGTKPAAFFPACVDLVREPLQKIYQEGPPLLILDSACEHLYTANATEYHAYSALDASSFEARRFSRQLSRRHRKEAYTTTVIIFDETRNGNTPALLQAIAELERSKPEFAVLPMTKLSGTLVDRADIPKLLAAIPNDPVSRRLRASLTTLPKGRKRGVDDRIRRRLERLTVVDIETAKGLVSENEAGAVTDRTLIADMSGEITLGEGELSVRFRGGRMNGLLLGRSEILSGASSAGRFVRGDQVQEYSTISAFSFEDQRARGLRVLQGFDGDTVASPGQIVADFSFEEGKPVLLVSLNVRHPEFKGDAWVTEYSILEIPLFSVPPRGFIEVEGVYPDGDRYSFALKPEKGKMLLFGSDFHFIFEDRELSLSFSAPAGAPPESLPVRFRPEGDGFLFCINPFGSYSPSPTAAFVGVDERCELTIDARMLRKQAESGLAGSKPASSAG